MEHVGGNILYWMVPSFQKCFKVPGANAVELPERITYSYYQQRIQNCVTFTNKDSNSGGDLITESSTNMTLVSGLVSLVRVCGKARGC